MDTRAVLSELALKTGKDHWYCGVPSGIGYGHRATTSCSTLWNRRRSTMQVVSNKVTQAIHLFLCESPVTIPTYAIEEDRVARSQVQDL
mmetsp:Transcript_75110/g.199462  ORF Transcript_75110/g.199462 Transcript_75110/m.199462 type:complete len:89 (+) Transcript_75110:174-440(+)